MSVWGTLSVRPLSCYSISWLLVERSHRMILITSFIYAPGNKARPPLFYKPRIIRPRTTSGQRCNVVRLSLKQQRLGRLLLMSFLKGIFNGRVLRIFPCFNEPLVASLESHQFRLRWRWRSWKSRSIFCRKLGEYLAVCIGLQCRKLDNYL